MPAFSHCFLKRFIAFSNDSPSLTRTPGILRLTTFQGPRRAGSGLKSPEKTRQYMLGRPAVKPPAQVVRHLQQPLAPHTVASQDMAHFPRLPVVLPDYDAELGTRQRSAVRSAMLLASPLLVAFSALDRATAPAAWLPLLAVRVSAALLLLVIGRAARGSERPEWLALASV